MNSEAVYGLGGRLRKMADHVVRDPLPSYSDGDLQLIQIKKVARMSRFFREHLRAARIATHVVWGWQELAIDIYQELFALEQFGQSLSNLPESDKALSDESIADVIQLYAKQNLRVLRKAGTEVSPQLHRLANRIEAYAFVMIPGNAAEAEEIRTRNHRKQETKDISRLVKKGVRDNNELARLVPGISKDAIRQEKSRTLREMNGKKPTKKRKS